MTDDRFSRDPDNSPVDVDDDEGDDFVEAVFIGPPPRLTGDRHHLDQLFLAWTLGTHYGDWNTAVRIYARVLRGLSEAGLIERRTIRRRSGRTHHGFVLTADGHDALQALSGDWITDRQVNEAD